MYPLLLQCVLRQIWLAVSGVSSPMGSDLGPGESSSKVRAGGKPPGTGDLHWKHVQRSISRGSLRIVSGLAANTNSIFGDSSSKLETANGCLVLQGRRNHQPRGLRAQQTDLILPVRALRSAPSDLAFLLTSDLHGCRQPGVTFSVTLPDSSDQILTTAWRFDDWRSVFKRRSSASHTRPPTPLRGLELHREAVLRW